MGFWGELIDLNGTAIWRKYIYKVTERGWPVMLLAQAYTKEVSTEDVNTTEQEDDVDEGALEVEEIVGN